MFGAAAKMSGGRLFMFHLAKVQDKFRQWLVALTPTRCCQDLLGSFHIAKGCFWSQSFALFAQPSPASRGCDSANDANVSGSIMLSIGQLPSSIMQFSKVTVDLCMLQAVWIAFAWKGPVGRKPCRSCIVSKSSAQCMRSVGTPVGQCCWQPLFVP